MLSIRYAAYLPFALCAALSGIAMFREETPLAFYAFLPMCFFIMGIVIVRQQEEIDKLSKSRPDAQQRAAPDSTGIGEL